MCYQTVLRFFLPYRNLINIRNVVTDGVAASFFYTSTVVKASTDLSAKRSKSSIYNQHNQQQRDNFVLDFFHFTFSFSVNNCSSSSIFFFFSANSKIFAVS